MNDTSRAYGLVTRTLHWGMAVLFVAQFTSAIAKRLWGKENAITEFLGPYHADIGVLLLALVIIRLAWAYRQRHDRPAHPGQHGKLVKGGHATLYALMVLVPAAAVLIRLGAGRPLDLFGMPILPPGDGIEWAKTLGFLLHKPLAWLLGAMIAGHIGMALYHRFVMRDDTLARMTRSASQK
jgi:cytochrome b561